MNHREIASIMAVTSVILPKTYANAITQYEVKKTMLYYATSIVNKQKEIEDRNTFFISNFVFIVAYQSKKADQNEVHAVKDLLQCSMSSAYHWG